MQWILKTHSNFIVIMIENIKPEFKNIYNTYYLAHHQNHQITYFNPIKNL